MKRSSNRLAARQGRSAPKQLSKADQLRRLTEGSFKLTRLNVWVAVAGVVVAIAAIVIPIVLSFTSHDATPPGVEVNVVPRDLIGGAAVYPAPGAAPNAFLDNSWSLRIDCLQAVKPNYLLAHIAAGPYQNHWIDVFDVKTATGGDVRRLDPMLPECGPPVSITPAPGSSQ